MLFADLMIFWLEPLPQKTVFGEQCFALCVQLREGKKIENPALLSRILLQGAWCFQEALPPEACIAVVEGACV